MSSRRIVILGAAVLLGLAAMLLTMRYVSGVEDQAASEAELVPALVARAPIVRGTPGAEAAASIGQEEVPANALPVDAIGDPAEIGANLALFDIQPGTPISSSMFAPDAVVNLSNSQRIEPGYVAFTVSPTVAQAVAGLVNPGDYVDVILFEDAVVEDGLDNVEQAFIETLSHLRGRTLMRRVKVFAVDRTLAPVAGQAAGTEPSEAPVGGGLITLQAPPEAAGVILAATHHFDFALTLANPEDPPRTVLPWPELEPDAFMLPGERDEFVVAEELTPEAFRPPEYAEAVTAQEFLAATADGDEASE